MNIILGVELGGDPIKALYLVSRCWGVHTLDSEADNTSQYNQQELSSLSGETKHLDVWIYEIVTQGTD